MTGPTPSLRTRILHRITGRQVCCSRSAAQAGICIFDHEVSLSQAAPLARPMAFTESSTAAKSL